MNRVGTASKTRSSAADTSVSGFNQLLKVASPNSARRRPRTLFQVSSNADGTGGVDFSILGPQCGRVGRDVSFSAAAKRGA